MIYIDLLCGYGLMESKMSLLSADAKIIIVRKS